MNNWDMEALRQVNRNGGIDLPDFSDNTLPGVL